MGDDATRPSASPVTGGGPADPSVADPAGAVFPLAGGVLAHRRGGVVYVDTRGYPRPTPLVAILDLVGRPDVGDVVIACFIHEPVFLLPELAERQWRWTCVGAASDAYWLRIERAKGESTR